MSNFIRRAKRRTVARDLSSGLAAVVCLVVVLGAVVYHGISGRRLRTELDEKASELTTEFVEVVRVPLLNLDVSTLRHACEVYLRSPYISGIRVVTDYGDELFERRVGKGRAWVERTVIVRDGGAEIGTVTLSFSDEETRLRERRGLVLTLWTAGGILVVVLVATHLLLRTIVSPPLERLRMGLKRIAAGDYDTPLDPVPQRDLDEIIFDVNDLARQISQKRRELAREVDLNRERQQLFRAVLESAADGILAVGSRGEVLAWNARFTEVWGLDADLPTRAERLEQLDRHLVGRLTEPVWSLIGKSPKTTEVVLTSGRVLECRWRPLLRDGRGGGRVWVFRDVTARVEGDHALRTMEEQLLQAQKMEAVGTLASGIAHDFNNLLQAISGYADLLAGRATLGGPERRWVERIQKSTANAADLVRELLTFSRKESPARHPVDLNRVVRETASMLERTLPKMIRIDLAMEEPLPVVLGDERQFEQVLMNLGTNARDAMVDGGVLTFSTRSVVLDAVRSEPLVGLHPGPHVVLEVADTGHGMDPEVVGHIFDPFFTTKEVGKGTGLGLASVYGIVRNHDGHISCRTALGEGALFQIYLPVLGDGIREGSGTGSTVPTVLTGRGRVLLVDDDPEVTGPASEYLGRLGYEVDVLDSGEAVVERVVDREQAPDLVVLDLGMPGMGGRACLERLRSEGVEVRVLVATGHLSEEDRCRLRALGVDAVLLKPYRLADLAGQIRRVIDTAPCTLGPPEANLTK